MLRFAITDFVNSAVRAIVAFGVRVMAGVHVVPIDDVNLPVRTVAEVQHLRREVAREQKVLAVVADEARSPAAPKYPC